jgi:DNA-binding NarL/FixJ family response regulator
MYPSMQSKGLVMPQISAVLALASPLLHARLRAELLLHPTIQVLHHTGIASQAVAETARLRPQILLCDRGMLLDPDLALLARYLTPIPPVVLVTVYKEGVPVGHVLPIAATIPFDVRPDELAYRLNHILNQAQVAMRLTAPRRPQVVPELQHRFTTGDAGAAAVSNNEQLIDELTSLPYYKQPVPSKSSHLAAIGFLRSVFDSSTSTSGKQ